MSSEKDVISNPAGVERISFNVLCERFERCTRPGVKPKDRVQIFFDAELRKLYLGGSSIFPYIRLILPAQDLERRAYGMKARVISKMYVEALSLTSAHQRAARLMSYQDPTKAASVAAAAANTGDFGSVVQEVLIHDCPQDSRNHSIKYVNDLLDRLSQATQVDERTLLFQKMVTEFTAVENKWLTRIILKDMKIGLKHERVLSFLHPDAPEIYNNNPDLRALVDNPAIRHPQKRIHTSITLGKPFYPMLCKRHGLDPTARRSDLFKSTASAGMLSFYIEDKLDGERVVVHKKNDQIFMFSRKCNELYDYAQVMGSMICEHVTCEEAIFDGEMMAWDSELGCFLPFGQNRGVILEQKQAGVHASRWMCYSVFDILWMRGPSTKAVRYLHRELPRHLHGIEGDITQQPLSVRKVCLNAVLTPVPSKLEMLQYTQVSSTTPQARQDEVVKHFESAINRQIEGLVVKRCDALYAPGDRKGSWMKLKPEYMEGASDTLDAVIVGGYYSESNRRKGISHFLVAVADLTGGWDKPVVGDVDVSKFGSQQQVSESIEGMPAPIPASRQPTPPVDNRTRMPRQWRILSKVGSGYNKQELLELQQRLEPFWLKVDLDDKRRQVPSMNSRLGGNDFTKGEFVYSRYNLPSYWGSWVPKYEDIPHVIIEPRNSVVLELVAAELLPTKETSSGFKLRFPRVIRARNDKLVSECDTLATLEHIWHTKRGKLAKTAPDGNYQLVKRNELRKIQNIAASGARSSGGASVPVLDRYTVPSSQTDVQFNSFKGKKICFIAPNEKDYRELPSELNSLRKVYDVIRALGGTPDHFFKAEDTYLVVAAKQNNVRVKSVINTLSQHPELQIDVVFVPYLVRCLDAGDELVPEPEELIYTCDKTKHKLKEFVDKYGDHFAQPTSRDSLQRILKKMPEPSNNTYDVSGLRSLAVCNSMLFRFTGIVAHFDLASCDPQDKRCPLFDTEEQVAQYSDVFGLRSALHLYRQHGGLWSAKSSPDVTHIVQYNAPCLPHKCDRKRRKLIHKGTVPILHPEWIFASCRAGKPLDPDDYIVNTN